MVGRVLFAPLMWPVIIEVGLVAGQHRSEVPVTPDERQVQTLAAKTAHEPLRVTIRPRRPDRRRPGTDRGEHSVERCGELRIPVADEELELGSALPEVDQEVPGLLGGPLPRRVRRHPKDVHPTGADLHHEEHIQPAQPHGVDMQEVTRDSPLAWEAPNVRHVGSDRRGAGPNRAEAKILRIVPSPTRQPTASTSPWILR